MKYQPNIPTDLYNKFIENLGYTPKNEKNFSSQRYLYGMLFVYK